MPPNDVRETVAAVWRMEAAKIVATLTRAVGDVGRAEDLAQEALVDALDQWPRTGVPRNPGAWLTTVAKRKAVDQWRRQDNLDAKYALLARELADHVDEAWDPDRIDDDVLRLMFMAAHPVLTPESRVALTLRVVGGLGGGTDSPEDELKRIDTEVSSVSYGRGGVLRIAFVEGGAWEQTDTRNFAISPRAGQKAYILKGALGSFFVSVNGQPGIRMRRVLKINVILLIHHHTKCMVIACFRIQFWTCMVPAAILNLIC